MVFLFLIVCLFFRFVLFRFMFRRLLVLLVSVTVRIRGDNIISDIDVDVDDDVDDDVVDNNIDVDGDNDDDDVRLLLRCYCFCRLPFLFSILVGWIRFGRRCSRSWPWRRKLAQSMLNLQDMEGCRTVVARNFFVDVRIFETRIIEELVMKTR